MKTIRIIPKLEIKGPNLVKGVHLEGLRVLGRPEDFAYRYYIDGADELIYMDIVASLYGRNNLLNIVRRTAKRVFIPLTVGGGIRTIEDIRNVLRAGADKVAINTAAIQNPNLIEEGARTFGSQCILVSIEAKRKGGDSYEAFTDNGRQDTGIDVFKWARMVYKLGAGEILITSIDRDGTGDGYDIELVSKISEIVPIPVIACGGAGSIDDIKDVIRQTKTNAVSAASIFHYKHIKKDFSTNKFEEGNIEFLKRYSQSADYKFKRIKPMTISDLKAELKKSSIACIRPMWQEGALNSIENQTAIHMQSGSAVDSSSLVVVDFGCGNLFSVIHALKKIDARFVVSSKAEVISKADKLILPGVGSFGQGISELKRRGLMSPIREHVEKNKPLLGICLGMQLLMSEGEEFGPHKGLDLIKGRCIKLPVLPGDIYNYKIPHIGWNQINPPHSQNKYDWSKEDNPWEDTILEQVSPQSFMYFVHSYIVQPNNTDYILAETEYGKGIFCSAVRKDNIYGCQFHPERSGEDGLNIYRQFVFSIGSQLIAKRRATHNAK